MTERFDKAKAETIQKYRDLRETLRLVRARENHLCGFCLAYKFHCGACPADTLCHGKLRQKAEKLISQLQSSANEGIDLIESLQEDGSCKKR